MKVDIVAESDDLFKIKVKQFGEVFVAKDEERVAIADTEEAAVEAVEEMQEQNQKAAEYHKPKQPVPLENRKGLGWFDGTSWGNN
jgi:hypothetical protein